MLAVSAPSRQGYSGPEACAAARVSYRRLDYWARTDLVVPSVRTARGSGTQRRYSYGDVIALAIIRELLDAGLSLQSVRPIAGRFRYLRPDDLDGQCLAITPRGASLATGPEIVGLLSGFGVVHVLPLGHIADDVEARLDEFDARRQERHARNL